MTGSVTGNFDLLLAAESLILPRTGIGNYTWNLYRELPRRPEIGRVVPMPYDGICVSTFRDLSWLRFPDVVPVERLHWIERHLPRALSQSTRIITTTEFVRREVVSVLGGPAERIDVVPLGVGPEYHPRPLQAIGPMPARHGLAAGGYLLGTRRVHGGPDLGRLRRRNDALIRQSTGLGQCRAIGC